MNQIAFQRPRGDLWLEQVFQCRATELGGVIRRQVVDVEREVGIARFRHAVARRGYRLIRTRHYFIIVCDPDPVEIVC